MITTNNYESLIERVGGIEKAKGIVEGAPEGATIISLATLEYFRELVNPLYENEPYRFLRIQITEDGLLRHSTRFAPIISPIDLKNLRTSIEHHDQLSGNSGEFKGGDLVVDSTGFFDWLCKVDYLSSDGRVVMYKHDKSKNDTAYQTWPNVESVRHATPLEITAGRRLDDTTDHVTDIRNHISPNTKVVNHG